MTDLVPANQIETLVGAPRHPNLHLARAVAAEHQVYILHSQRCLDTTADLRDCIYSVALDHGIDPEDWEGHEDEAVPVKVDLLLKPDLQAIAYFRIRGAMKGRE